LGTRVFIIVDNNNPVKNKLDDFVRGKLLESEHYKVWKKDFEDIFESNTIVKAMKLSTKKNFEFQMKKEDLDSERNSKTVFKILKDYMDSINPNNNFKKTDLAREIAYQSVEEIRDMHCEMEFVKEIRKIMEFVNA